MAIVDDDSDQPKNIDRTLTLLWRRELGETPGSRGPKQRVSVDEVIAAAIEIADAEGLAALSMRKVAERLGLGAMSIYTYVPGRSELIGLMVDEVAGDLPLEPHAQQLRDRMTQIARLTYEEYHRHRWLLQVENSRPWIGPHCAARYEWQVSALDGVGFTDLQIDKAVTLLVGFAESAARMSVNMNRTTEQSGMTDVEWWEINAPILERVMNSELYPVSRRVGQAAGEAYQAVGDPEGLFAFGLERILDGLEELLAH